MRVRRSTYAHVYTYIIGWPTLESRNDGGRKEQPHKGNNSTVLCFQHAGQRSMVNDQW